MEVTFSHPRVGGGAHEVGGGHWNTLLPFILSEYYLINSTDFSIRGCI